MKKLLIAVLGISLLSICLAACGWKPEVTAVPLTAPWSAMNLPVKENAVVWKSESSEFRAVHKEDKQFVMTKYAQALKAQGWTLGKFDSEPSGAYATEMQKGGEKFSVRVYDFDNTGVAIEKK